MSGKIEEGELTLDGVRVFYRRVAGEGTPVVYCHGNPTHGEDWLPFLERGGPAIAIDMPGWGRSDRPDPASTTRCTGSRPSSSAASTSSGSGGASWSSTTGAGWR